MAQHPEEQEVIDPSDPRYRRPDDFKSHNRDPFQNQRGTYRYDGYIGCAPIGCLPGCLFSILISILLTLLLNLIF